MQITTLTQQSVDVPSVADVESLAARIAALEAKPDAVSRAELDALVARVTALELGTIPPPPPPPPPSLGVNTLFFDDFEADVGWRSVRTPVPRFADAPSKWSSYVAPAVAMTIESGAGKNGSAGLVYAVDWPKAYAETGRLVKEVIPEHTHWHLRMVCKLSEGFVWGTTAKVNSQFWKWWRVQQSPWTRGRTCPPSTNGEDNTNFIVGGVEGGVRLAHCACYRTQAAGSTSAPATLYKTRAASGIIPFGNLDPVSLAFTETKWTQVDVSYRLGETDKDNGSIDVWYDGIKQAPFDAIYPDYGGAVPVTKTGLTTNPRSHEGNGPGWNVFCFLDNYSNLTINWTKQHLFYVDSVTIFDGIPNDLTS